MKNSLFYNKIRGKRFGEMRFEGIRLITKAYIFKVEKI